MPSSVRFFGTYLIQHKGIAAKHVYKALEQQKQLQPSLELLAQQIFNLDPLDVINILNRQVESHRPFEDAALELSFLDQDQINELLDKQANCRKKLGVILVEMDVLSESEKENMLNDYRNWLEASSAYGKAISSGGK